jgi:small subunit ribosomal protein S8
LKFEGETKKQVISGLRTLSKPGRRRYVGADEIPSVLRGLGLTILSTSKGVMTDKEARKQKVGGELLCSVW